MHDDDNDPFGIYGGPQEIGEQFLVLVFIVGCVGACWALVTLALYIRDWLGG